MFFSESSGHPDDSDAYLIVDTGSELVVQAFALPETETEKS